jgi:hypothetical protein
VDIPCKENPAIKEIDCDKKLDRELRSIDLCTEMEEDTNQKQDCNIDSKINIKDDETNKNICTEAPAKPDSPVTTVKIIKPIASVISNKPKQGSCINIKDDETNKNICTKAPAKPNPPVTSVKKTKPIASVISNKPRYDPCSNQTKVKQVVKRK